MRDIRLSRFFVSLLLALFFGMGLGEGQKRGYLDAQEFTILMVVGTFALVVGLLFWTGLAKIIPPENDDD